MLQPKTQQDLIFVDRNTRMCLSEVFAFYVCSSALLTVGSCSPLALVCRSVTCFSPIVFLSSAPQFSWSWSWQNQQKLNIIPTETKQLFMLLNQMRHF